MPDAHANLAISSVATAPSPAASGTSLVVAAGEGARFPATPFNATVWPATARPDPSNAEIVRVTNRSTDTLTITRSQESSSARTIVVGDLIAATVTAKSLTDIEGDLTTAFSRWTTIVKAGRSSFGSAVAANTFLSQLSGSLFVLNASGSGLAAFRLDPADIPVPSGKTLQLRLKTTMVTASTASGVNWTLALSPVATFGTVSNTVAVATLSAATLSVSKTTPAGSSQLNDETSAITFPSAGYFVFSTVNSGTTATNSWTGIDYELQARVT